MSGTDDLRTVFAKRLGSHLVADPPKRGVTGNSLADEVMRVIAEAATDPVRRLALLDAMGLDVLGTVGDVEPDHRIVVRPRGEATDAGRHVPFGVDDSNDIAEFYRGEDELRKREHGEATDE